MLTERQHGFTGRIPKYRLREVSEQTKELPGSYKREDLFVAHTYRDAIRRSWGAFVIYPGEENLSTLHREYREMMPGVGAFPVRPTVNGQPNGIEAIGTLLKEVVQHFGGSHPPRERLRNAAWTASGSYSAPKGGGLILVPGAGGCVALSSSGGENRFAVRLSGLIGKKILAIEAWKICGSILIEGNDASSFLLAPITANEEGLVELNSVESLGHENSIGLCTIVRLDLEAAVRVSPRSATSIVNLGRFTETYLGCCATTEILKEFALLS